jgi:hypothetical protein
VPLLALLLAAAALVAAPAAPPAPAAPAPRQAEGSWWDRTDPGRGRLPTSRYYVIRSDLSAAETKA